VKTFRCAFAVTLFALLAAPGMAQDKEATYRDIDAATIASYMKLGAHYGVWHRDGFFGPRFLPGRFEKLQGLRGFRFEGKVPDAKLPEVGQPFGLDLSFAEVTETGFKNLSALNNLTVLKLQFTTGVSAAGLRHVAKCKDLQFLDLEGEDVPGAALRELAPLGKLEFLSLRGNKIKDAELKELVALKSLKALLPPKNMGDGGLKEVAALTELTQLDLSFSFVTDAGLKQLAPLKKLAKLHLEKTGISDTGLKNLASHKDLVELNLYGTRVGDAGMKELAGLTKLAHVTLIGTKVTDDGMRELAALTDLSYLALGGTKVGDNGVKELVGLKKLSFLSIPGTKVTDAGLKELAALKSLKRLEVSRKSGITKKGISELQKALPECQIN
jgi:internalin A